MLNVDKVREDFPILKRKINGYPLAYLDNAATSQKPKVVIEALKDYYERYNANVHRGIYTIAEEATTAYEGVRKKVKEFLNAGGEYEVIFVRNTTEAINLVAISYGFANFKKDDEILLTQMEHHSNIVPWFMIAKETGAKVVFAKVNQDGLLDLPDLKNKISSRIRIVSLTHVSNVLGTINPVKEVVEEAHKRGIPVLIDSAQSVPHLRVNVSSLKPDFLAFSAHKMLGPMGVGILVGRKEHLEKMEPVFGGGDMISKVTLSEASWNVLPWKFEAGTPNVADVIATGAAIDYLTKTSLEEIREHEKQLTKYALEKLAVVPKLRILGTKNIEKRGGVVSFNIEGIHPHDLSTILDGYGVAIRAGHHCAQPLHQHLNLPASARASFYLYNTEEEIDRLVEGIEKAKEVFRI